MNKYLQFCMKKELTDNNFLKGTNLNYFDPNLNEKQHIWQHNNLHEINKGYKFVIDIERKTDQKNR